jgi:hypothetical protein
MRVLLNYVRVSTTITSFWLPARSSWSSKCQCRAVRTLINPKILGLILVPKDASVIGKIIKVP